MVGGIVILGIISYGFNFDGDFLICIVSFVLNGC